MKKFSCILIFCIFVNMLANAITWTNIVGCFNSSGNLTKTDTTNWGNGGVFSTETVGNYQYAQTVVAETNYSRVFGLSSSDADANWSSINFGIVIVGSGAGGPALWVVEAGSFVGVFSNPTNFGSFANGDVLKVAIECSTVKYYKNGNLFYTSTNTPTLPLKVDVALYDQGATIQSVTIGSITPPAFTYGSEWIKYRCQGEGASSYPVPNFQGASYEIELGSYGWGYAGTTSINASTSEVTWDANAFGIFTITATACDEYLTTYCEVIVCPTAEGGTAIAVNPSISVDGSTSIILTNSTATGTQNSVSPQLIQWQTNASGTWVDIQGATNYIYNTPSLTQATSYRAFVTSGYDPGTGRVVCSSDYSDAATVTTTLISFPSFLPGGVVFAGDSGRLEQDTSSLFWDITNKRLGIGTNDPSEKLTVVGNTRLSGWLQVDSFAGEGYKFDSLSANSFRLIYINQFGEIKPPPTDDPLVPNCIPTMPWGLTGNMIGSDNYYIGTCDNYPFRIYTNGTEKMRITPEGKVGIGIFATEDMPEGYQLYVKDGILTEKCKVAVYGEDDWSDFVFANDYNLMPLNELEKFIKQNNHLPNVPSAKEVVKTGIDVAKMDALLLQKIEELTLYIFELQKQIDELRSGK